MSIFERQVAHSAQQAMQPGWYAYAQAACSALESDRGHNGLFIGLRARVGVILKAGGYRPARHELGEFN